MKLYFLKPIGNKQPTKSFKYIDGSWHKVSEYPLMKNFQGIVQECSDLMDFHDLLKKVFTKPVFMIHGEFIQGIDTHKMVRRSRSNKGDPTITSRMLDLFCIDIDDYECPELMEEPEERIEYFIARELPVEFSSSDYVYQLSSQYGLTTPNLRAHLFFCPRIPIHNTRLHEWAMKWNKQNGSTIIDPAIYRAVQPIYTMKRVVEGAEDPIHEGAFIDYINKGHPLLDWEPQEIEEIALKGKDSSISGTLAEEDKVGRGNLVNLQSPPQDFDISSSIRKIMTSDNFHDQIRSTALSLINKNVTPNDTRVFLEEFMLVAKSGIRGDSARLADWQTRFDDIPRAVESAVEIVDAPSYDDVINWIRLEGAEDPSVIQKDFAKKLQPFEGVELRNLIREIDLATGFGLRAITEDVKAAKADKQKELADIARKIKSEERVAQGIFEMEITNSSYGATTTSICKILAKSEKEPEVYRLGNSLSIIEMSIPKTIRQITTKERLAEDYPPMPIVHDISAPVGVIRNRVEKDCVFINETGREIVCPDSILNAVPKMYNIPWKPLSGIVEHPFVDDKWNIVEKNGYDPSTGLYAILHHKLKIKLMKPKTAYKYITEEVFEGFPFQTELDQAGAVGAFMTAIQRPYVMGDHGMPGFAIVSPKPSSGKTTLAQLLSYSIYNRPIAATGWSDNDEELGKHLLAILREGHSCVLFDNIKKDAAIKSNELAKAMTSGTYSRRKLGVNETEEVPSSVLWLFTGNNIVFKGDFATRILPIRIVPTIEHPEFRKFKRKDIGQWAMDNRKKIISAILSIVLAGKDIDPEKDESSARFKEWNKFIRLPLLKVSGQDLLHVFNRNDFLDDEAMARGDLLELLYKTFGSSSFMTKDIMKLIEGENLGLNTVPIDGQGLEFRHAITNAFNEKSTTNIKTLGRFILGMKDFILRGFMLIREDGHTVAKWKVVPIDENKDG